jgi:hypothetical protein
VLTYRVRLDVPRELILFVSRLLARRRREIGTRKNARCLGRSSGWRESVRELPPLSAWVAPRALLVERFTIS